MKKFAPVLAAALVACLCLVLLPACSSPSPTDVVKTSLDAVKAQDAEALAENYAGDASAFQQELNSSADALNSEGMTDEQKAVAETFMQKMYDFDYTVGEETIDGDKATVKVTITSYDMGTAFEKAMSTYIEKAFAQALGGASQDSLEAMLYDELNKELGALTEKGHTADVDMTLTKVDGKWQLDEFSDDAADAFSGGLLGTINGINEKMSNL